MNVHVNKSQSETASIASKQADGNAAFQLADNKPEAIAQRKLQDMVHSSQQAKQLMAFQAMANMSPQTRQAAQLQTMANNSGVLQRYPTLDDSGRLDAVIYVIYENNGKTDGSNVLYVGQATSSREFKRFQEHVSNDAWAPWYIHATPQGINYDDDRDNWPYDYVVIENLKNVTKFETTVAEQWWMEHYLTKGQALLNDSTPCTIGNFNARSGDPSLYDPANIGITSSYKPSMKAK